MSKNYDNWERLVTAVVLIEQLREMAMNDSMDSTYSSNISFGSSFDFDYSFRSNESLYYDNQELSFPNLPAAVESDAMNEEEEVPSQSFVVGERNGKICYMSGVRELLILMRRTSQYWDWSTHPDSRFSEVAVLHYGRYLDIRGRMKTQKLSPSTLYAAYLVFKLTSWSKGLESVNAVVNFFNEESDRDAEERARNVYLQPGNRKCGSLAVRRVDGWMELEIGNFYTDVGHDKAVEARVLERTSWKTGLIVEGIEFRPLSSESPLVHEQRFQLVVAKLSDDEETEESEINISLLQEFAPLPDPKIEDSQTPTTSDEGIGSYSDVSQLDLVIDQRITDHEPTFESTLESHDTTYSSADRFCPDWNLKKNSSLKDKGVGVEMMAKLLLPRDESLLAALTRDELFSGGYDSLSELVYFFHGMKRMVEVKDVEANDLKQKLLKSEVEVQLALSSKDSELEELRKQVEILKFEAMKAAENIKEG
ncbi:hypothetical protein RD792_009710 [Penstemon davidsonii]|uniref:Uncharacterized protein n=1 Tax=Penstemon davidsonii TaxID=160366 RepID=A0ABR0D1M4_9LAMI|nr:hypothetical protein RD792_009700 [Penstemon davidsonii]KAK4482543.1 hypothetical protein RD792_009703 [Penstemon davidsonii]KAK4482550.1 hypothetical protein RD792_009710 [Penstemon davidsonii]